MKKYKPIEELISNETVIHILSEARLPGEGDLLAEILEKSEEKSDFKIYAISVESEMVYLANVIRKKDKIGIINGYVNFEGNWKVDTS